MPGDRRRTDELAYRAGRHLVLGQQAIEAGQAELAEVELAEVELRESAVLGRQLLASFPDALPYRQGLGSALYGLGSALTAQGRFEEASPTDAAETDRPPSDTRPAATIATPAAVTRNANSATMDEPWYEVGVGVAVGVPIHSSHGCGGVRTGRV
jgi:hypothetical protein